MLNTLEKDKVGFALGGLGGFHAHDVGFLQAARQLKVRPDIISCTSGMIAWVARWLDGNDPYGEDLEPLILEKYQKDTRFPPSLDWLNTLSIGLLFGSYGIARPAWLEYWAHWLTPMTSREELAEQLLDRLFPAQVEVPLRRREDMEHIADVLNKSSMPVVFNSLHPKLGKAYLHINEAAQTFLKVPDTEIVSDKEIGKTVGPQQKYARITPQTVGGALWLLQYGFEHAVQHRLNPLGLVDGAYSRLLIISELDECDRIYTVRPANTKWLDHPPRNYIDSETFKAWMLLNSAYTTEVAGMETINEWIRQKKLPREDDPDPPHLIELIPVEIERYYGFLQYIHEEKEVYETAFNKAMSALYEHEKVGPSERLAGEREEARSIAVR